MIWHGIIGRAQQAIYLLAPLPLDCSLYMGEKAVGNLTGLAIEAAGRSL